VGGGIYLAVNASRNRSQGIDAIASKYLTQFDQNSDSKINVEFEAAVREQKTSTYYDSDGFPHTSRYTVTESMKPLAQRADAPPVGNGDGSASFEEMVKVIRTYDRGDGSKHAAGDGVLGGKERRDYNRDYGIKSFSN